MNKDAYGSNILNRITNDASLMYENTKKYRLFLLKTIKKNTRLEITLKWIVAISLTPFLTNPEILNNNAARWVLSTIPLLAVLIPLLNIPKSITKAKQLYKLNSEIRLEVKKLLVNIELMNRKDKVTINRIFKKVRLLQGKLEKNHGDIMLMSGTEKLKL